MKKFKKLYLALGLFSVLLTVLVSVGYYVINKNLLSAKVLGVHVEEIESKLKIPSEINIEINTGTSVETFKLHTSEFEAVIDYNQTSNNARETFSVFFKPTEINPVIELNEAKLDEQLSVLAGQVYLAPQIPDIEFKNNLINVNKGILGRELDIKELKSKLISNLSQLSSETIHVETKKVGRELTDDEVSQIIEKSKTISSLNLTFERYKYVVSAEQMLELIFDINGTQVGPFETLLNDLRPNVERAPQNPVFVEQNGKVAEFSPAKTGVEIDKQLFKTQLFSGVPTVSIPVKTSNPEITTEQINSYGIKELIGYGESYYRGSIPERIHNVALATSKFNGVLIKPGEVFSFVDTIGDISSFTGFKQSYVIMNNQTVLGDGGGVCQVSTTLFRAAINAGLEIVERRPHAYRVGYYEQGFKPGLDATIYSPTVDLKVKNDTGNYILIQAHVENSNKLIIEFYGTSDGRIATVSEPIISEVTPAPEDLYIDDPTLPTGTVKQIDYKASGAKVSFDYKVVKNGNVLSEKTFFSNYRPWQAKFLRGTGPAI